MKAYYLKCQKGFSLVELMVALVLGLLVMAGAIQVFVIIKSTYNDMSSLAQRQEAIRFIADAIARDARTAPIVHSLPHDHTGTPSSEVYFQYEPPYLGHPYCASGGSLHLVRYYGDDVNNSLGVDVWCENVVVDLGGDHGEDVLGVLDPADTSVDLPPTFGETLQVGVEEVGFSKSGLGYSHLASVPSETLNSYIPFQIETKLVLSDELFPEASSDGRTFIFNTFRREELMKKLELIPDSASGAI